MKRKRREEKSISDFSYCLDRSDLQQLKISSKVNEVVQKKQEPIVLSHRQQLFPNREMQLLDQLLRFFSERAPRSKFPIGRIRLVILRSGSSSDCGTILATRFSMRLIKYAFFFVPFATPLTTRICYSSSLVTKRFI